MKNNTLLYKGFRGTIDYSSEDDCLFGKLVGIDDLVTYEGQSLAEIKGAFHEAVEDYLVMKYPQDELKQM